MFIQTLKSILKSLKKQFKTGVGNPQATSGPREIFVRSAILHWVDIMLHYNWLTVRRIFEIEILVRIHGWLLLEIYIAEQKI